MSYMKDPHERNVTSFGPIDEIQPLEKNPQIVIAPIRAMLE
jgi:hypothetical protein